MRRSQITQPHPHRLLSLFAKLYSGQPITVLAIGGSVTASVDLPGGVESGNGSYAYHITRIINEV